MPTIEELQAGFSDLQRRLDAAAATVAALQEPAIRLLEPRFLRPVAAYRVPTTSIDGKPPRYASGNWDFRDTPQGRAILWHHSMLSGRVVQSLLPATPGDPLADPTTWPLLGAPSDMTPPTFWDWPTSARDLERGVYWDAETNTLLVSARNKYTWGGGTPDQGPKWLARFQVGADGRLADATETRVAPNGSRNWYGGGFCRLPQNLAAAHFGGRRFGIGLGGYELLDSSVGPTLAAGDANGDLLPLLAYPSQQGAAKSCQRDAAYELVPHTNGFALNDTFIPRSGNVGRWQGDRAYQSAWLDAPGFVGVAMAARLVRGTCDYRIQDVGPSLGAGNGSFSVARPDIFYSDAVSPWSTPDRVRHGNDPSLETWNASKMPGWCYPCLLVYDPADLLAVAAGTMQHWEPVPRQYDFPTLHGGTTWRGMRYDQASGLLWAWLQDCWGSSRFNHGLVAFELGDFGQVNPPMAMPAGWTYNPATGDVVKVA